MLDQSRIETLRRIHVAPALHIVDGQRRASVSGQTRDVISPIDGAVLTTMTKGAAAAGRGGAHGTYGGSDPTVPPGGVKQSGNGPDKSLYAFDNFLNHKTAWIKQ